MGLIAPWFLAGLAAVALPVWLHLLQQHKVDPLRFPSLQFFERRTETSVRQRRLKYLALLSLRILLLALLALLFAEPFLWRPATAVRADRHLLLIDNSFSMSAGTALAEAKRQALEQLAELPPADLVQVIAVGGKPALLTQFTNDRQELRAAIQAVAPTASRNSLAETARALRSVFEGIKSPIDAHLFSDLQRSAMPASFQELAMPDGVQLTAHSAPSESANYAVENVIAPAAVSDPKAARVTATIAALGAPARSLSVSLLVNGKTVASKEASVGENGRASVEFVGLDASYGWNRGEVRITAQDALPGDNVFRFAFERSDPRRVLLLHPAGRARAVTYVKAALEASAESSFQLEPLAVEQADASRLQSAAVVILSDISTLPAGLSSALDKFVERGGGVLLTAGASNASSRTLPLSGWTAGESRYASRSGDRFFSVSQSDASSALIGLAAKWEGVRFFQIVPVQAKDATVLARLNDGTPVLLEQRRGEGRVLALASALDNLANDFPLHASFVPFIEQACRRLAQVESGQATLVVDSAAELRAAGSKAAVAVEVLDPKGRRVLDLKSATTAQSVPLTEEGFYEIGRQSGRRELIAVNADRAESNLEAAPQEAIDLWTKRQGSTPGAAAGPVRADEQRQSLWWYLAALLLAATLAESVYASRYLRPSQN